MSATATHLPLQRRPSRPAPDRPADDRPQDNRPDTRVVVDPVAQTAGLRLRRARALRRARLAVGWTLALVVWSAALAMTVPAMLAGLDDTLTLRADLYAPQPAEAETTPVAGTLDDVEASR